MPQVLSRIEPLHSTLVAPQDVEMRGMTPQGDQLFYEEIPRTMAVPKLVPSTIKIGPCLDCGGDSRTGKRGSGKIVDTEWDCYRCDGKGEHEIGDQEFKKDPAGNRVYPLNRHKRYTQRRLYFIRSQGNANNEKVDYRAPTEREVAEQERSAGIAKMQETLAATLFDEGFTPQELVAKLRGGPGVKREAQTVGPNGPVEPGDGPVVETEPPVEIKNTEPLGEMATDGPTEPDPDKTYPYPLGGGHYELSNGDKARGEDAALKAEIEIQDARKEMAGSEFF